PSTPQVQRQYFNLAHCECSRAGHADLTSFSYEVSLTAQTNLNKPVDFLVGLNCDDPLQVGTKCRKVDSLVDIDQLFRTPRISFSTYDVINSVDNTAACQQREGDALIWAMVDTTGDAQYDFSKTHKAGTVTGTAEVTGIDTRPPPQPSNLRVSPGENSISIEWDQPTGSTTDLFAFQALCATLDDMPIRAQPPKAQFQTPNSVCGANTEVAVQVSNVPRNEEETRLDAPPEPFKTLDSRFLCAEENSGTATKITIKSLENGTPYKVQLIAVDLAGNFVTVFFNQTVTPRPVIDFWEDLNAHDNELQGGCLLAQTYGDGNPLTRTLRDFRDDTLARSSLGRWLIDAYYATLGKLGGLVAGSTPLRIVAGVLLAPLVAIALAWHLLGLPLLLLLLALPWLWRRVRSRLAQRARRLAVVAIVLAPGLASADDFTPYWEDPGAEQAAHGEPGEVHWHVGVRAGPYIPEIDLKLGLNALTGKGPYEAMFGDYVLEGETRIRERHVWQVLPMLDIDRVLWSGFGQLTVGGSIGYMQKTARAYAEGTNANMDPRPRVRDAKNTFRLIPLAAMIGYRFTYLDDRWGIPVVPYARAGLSYYAWWITAPDGNVAKVCDAMPMPDSDCEGNKALGGSFGYQGSIGLAIRAERIDRSAAISMRNSGIQHAGFYAELYWAKVDGFGSDSKLSVGDTTWFAGVNFEF
ncbi:MAG: MXAN_2562 family outer membrane beta-barrel protein, partial [Kofleriaceae bacterium]